MDDLNTVIEDAVTDAELPDNLDASSTEEVPDPAPEPETTDNTEPSPDSAEVKSPAAEKQDTKTEDDFDKKYGLSQQSASGRENRIPYSRVRKITDKAVKDAQTAWSKGLETSHVPVTKYQEVEAKVKDYESRLAAVGEFEQVMTNDPERFLTYLQNVPAYKPFFQKVFELAAQVQSPQAQAQAQVSPDTDMPQPDQTLPDGSTVYSLDGLRKLQEWNRNQAKREALAEFEARIKAVEAKYEPMVHDYQSFQAQQSVLPAVQQQIAEARQWPLFNESEAEIVQALQKNKTWNLERAYQSVVLPKLQANRDAMRQELLAEVKKAPRATAASTGSVRPAPRSGNTPQSLEDVIKASLEGLTNR